MLTKLMRTFIREVVLYSILILIKSHARFEDLFFRILFNLMNWQVLDVVFQILSLNRKLMPDSLYATENIFDEL